MTSSAATADQHLILRLPGLVAGRDLADTLLDRLAPSYAGRVVIVDATATSSASASFASQVVHRVLVLGGAASLTLAGAPPTMVTVGQEVAAAAGKSDLLHVADTMPRVARTRAR